VGAGDFNDVHIEGNLKEQKFVAYYLNTKTD